jgi:MoxR-like ATPase
MSEILEQTRNELAAGKCVLCVRMANPFELVQSFTETDPQAGEAARPVLYWDAEDGLSAAGLTPSDDLKDALKALAYAGKHTGPAIFVFNLDGSGIEEAADAFRRTLKRLAASFSAAKKRALILSSRGPLPASIAGLFPCLGYEQAAPEAAAPTPAVASPAVTWREIRQLDAFDSPKWRKRMETLGDHEVLEIIHGDYHAEAVQRVREMREAMKKQFSQKDEIINLMTYAMVAQVPMVLLGPPGTGKSLLARTFCQGLGLSAVSRTDAQAAGDGSGDGEPTGGLFEYLLTRYTTPEEIFGPVHIQDLIDKRLYRRVTTGRLPEAEVAFLDEIFKASSAIVNTLLAILNERIFHNADKVQRVPLVMIFAASNEPPQDPQLGALYDRFPIRANCGRVEDEQVGELWQRSWEMGYDREFNVAGLSLPRISCTNDFRLLHRVAMCKFGGRSVAEASRSGHMDFNAEFVRIFRSLRRDYDISDRTIRVLYALSRATAVVEQRNLLSAEELDVFRYVGWDETQAGELARLVNNLKRGGGM